ncbi:prolipoprotein diacylglyceryl transferase family protein [Gynuella sunshinyii]|uniref:Prolipoprotein diacylglyceryltransferase n=1 Tax=Gynuella sunshinyii YC6258 TaxID=1445510 RepID=A0A0C5VFP1_9GAMM|nr:prolipoprotein diacylglyceryl transferase family protein [Gynuella sunshinyii]AJQ93006.1 prolipoprotein diacylglyceryltransferase [Gynuella sunshinyii YC6258]
MLQPLTPHIVFDCLALLLAIVAGIISVRWKLKSPMTRTAAGIGAGYFIALSLGSMTGSFALGTANLYLSGVSNIGRSIAGALFGATLTVELYKLQRGTRGSTGYMYVIPFCVLVIVGRLGCFFSGLADHTYGTPTTLPWGVDFGDGMQRHPVQLYESLSMLMLLMFVIFMLRVRQQFIVDYGYYLCVGFYGGQRFLWEFLKPYAALLGSLNLFHIICLLLMIYSIAMSLGVRNGYRTT